ncbi:MAG TPA: UDP-3-O-(3-hydroxymyristoyl)glucosamine N-acyltransferase [Thermoanaerobaculia bacterium]|nr:UDP-3-O-(3-hydroxymyristoyl)glucosamine N-acyltransferase [Thermoanaerobaculia bacterium]
MSVPIAEIVEFVDGSYAGPRDLEIAGVAPLSTAANGQLSFLSNPKYAAQLATTGADAILVAKSLEGDDRRFIRVDDPYFSLARVVARWFAKRPMPNGISPQSAIASSAKLGDGVAVGAFTVLGDDAVIGDGTIVYSNVTIEPGTIIGSNCIIYPQVSIYAGSKIGDRCIVHSGVVIGSDGYGFATHGGRHHKIPQIGIVRIENDVEIGAGTTIDRAALGETVIGEGTKIDNLVQIAHNVRVGKHCLLVSQVGIAGSTELGDYVVVAGQSGFAGHLKIGTGVQVAAKSAVLRDVPDNTKVMGSPAVPFRDFARREAALKRLSKGKVSS